jgi:plastocyanin
MKRRQFVERVGIGAAGLLVAAEGTGIAAAAAGAGRQEARQEKHHGHSTIDGLLSSASVSFGAWPASPEAPLDRMTAPDAPVAPNAHQVIPYTTIIKVGGSVRFAIAGAHQIAVYGPGTEPGDINTSLLIPIPGAPPQIGLIDDPANRIYRGPNPLTASQDRVEVVQFNQRGLYLVICTVSIHFFDGMFGWVRVLR